MSYWTAFSYATDWSDFGGGYNPGGFKIDGDRVNLRGALKTTATGAWPFTIATLPSEAFPPNPVILAAIKMGFDSAGGQVIACSIVVDTSGNILLEGPGTSLPTSTEPLSLDGLSFSLLS